MRSVDNSKEVVKKNYINEESEKAVQTAGLSLDDDELDQVSGGVMGFGRVPHDGIGK